MDELEISSSFVRWEMLAEPERASRVLRTALSKRGIRNRAAFAIARFRAGDGAKPEPRRQPLYPAGPQPEPGPPSLADLERAWSIESDVGPALVSAMRAAIERAGGFAALSAGAWRQELEASGLEHADR